MPNRRTFVALTAIAASLFTLPALAVGSLVEVQLVDRSRGHELLDTWSQRGVSWVAGTPGSRYAVRLSNRSGARVLVVLSIDGINAVSGETAATGQTGYVLAPFQSAEITGWRKSLTEAAAFYFTALPDSYAARTDRPENVGVIGVAVFREREYGPELRPYIRRDRGLESGATDSPREAQANGRAAPPSPAATAAPRQQEAAKSAGSMLRDERLGTGHGEREYAPTSQTSFERESEQPNEVVRIRYDSRERLIALGVIRTRRLPAVPDPFPGFVPDRKG